MLDSFTDFSYLLFPLGGSLGFYILYLGIDERQKWPGYTNTTMILGYILIILEVVLFIYFFGILLGIFSLVLSFIASLILHRLNIPYRYW